jgi:hypothetical protein
MSRVLVDATGTFPDFRNEWYSNLPNEFSDTPCLQIVVMPDTVDVRDCIADYLAGKIPEPLGITELQALAPDVPKESPATPPTSYVFRCSEPHVVSLGCCEQVNGKMRPVLRRHACSSSNDTI